jgi:hypothetical protein
MRGLTLGLAIAFAAAGFLMLSSVGKCGMGKYYSKKDKGCVAK